MAKKKGRHSRKSSANVQTFDFWDLIGDGALLASLFLVLPFSPYRLENFVTDKHTLLNVLVVIILAGWVMKAVKGWRPDLRKYNNHPIAIGAVLLVSVTIVSTVFSLSPVYSWIGKIRIPNGTLSYVMYFILMAQSVMSMPRFRPFVIPSVAILTFFQFVWAFFSAPRLDATWIVSTAGNPNYLSSWLVLGIFVLFYEIVDRWIFRDNANQKPNWMYIGYLALFIIFAFITMVVGGGRGALLALIISVGGTILMLGVALNRLRIVVGGGTLAIGAIVVFVLIAAYVPGAQDTFRVFRLSDTRRFDLFEGGVNIIADINEPLTDYSGNPDKYVLLRPIIGYGPEMVFQLQQYWDMGDYLESNTSWSHHNHTLDTIIEKGILGLLAWGIIIYGATYYLFREIGWLYLRDVPFFAIITVITAILSGYGILWLFPEETWRSAIALVIGLATPLSVYVWVFIQGILRQINTMRGGERNSKDDDSLSITKKQVFLIFAVNFVFAHWIDMQFGFAQVVSEPLFWFMLGWIIYETLPQSEENTEPTPALVTSGNGWIIATVFGIVHFVNIANVTVLSALKPGTGGTFAILISLLIVGGVGYFLSPDKDDSINWWGIGFSAFTMGTLWIIGQGANEYLRQNLANIYPKSASSAPMIFFIEGTSGILLTGFVIAIWMAMVWRNIETQNAKNWIALGVATLMGTGIYALDFINSATINLAWTYMENPNPETFLVLDETVGIMENYIVFPQDLDYTYQFSRFRFMSVGGMPDIVENNITQGWLTVLESQPYFAGSVYGKAFTENYQTHFGEPPPQP